MMRSRKDIAAIAAVVLLSVVAAVVLTRLGPAPAADVARGSEEAFGRGLHRRELPPGIGPQRCLVNSVRRLTDEEAHALKYYR